jgi:transposase-like protein
MNSGSKGGATPPPPNEAFKQQAVRLWRSGRRSVEEVARELGISVFQLYGWGKR